MAFFVTKILDFNVVMITPEWRIWKHNKGGNRVQLTGYTIAKDAGTRRDAKKQLMAHLLNNKIQLKNISGISASGNLLAEVWVRGANVASQMGSFAAAAPKKAPKPAELKQEESNPEVAQTAK